MPICQRRQAGRPTRAEAADIDDRVLDAARTIFCRQGIAATSIGDVASASRVTKHTIYRRYRNKAALIDAVVSRDIAGLAETFAPDRAAPGPLAALEAAALKLFTYTMDPDRSRFIGFLEAEGVFSDDMRDRMADWEELVLGPLAACTAAAQAVGEIGSGDPVAIATMLLDLVSGLARRHRTGQRFGSDGGSPDAAFAERWRLFRNAVTTAK
jgi:AcrR family transcriptional regulator